MKLKFIAPAIASAALIGTALTSGVATAGTPTAAPTATVAKSAPIKCVAYIRATESVKIRAKKSLNSTGLGVFDKDARACRTGNPSSGGGATYHVCGKTDAFYFRITYRGIQGWIPAVCTMNYS